METIKVGDNFLIHVNIKKAKNVFGFVTSLNFPVDALEINQNTGQPDVVMGKFLGDKATILANLSLNTTNNVGTLIIGYSLKGATPEKNGGGLMFSIRVRAVKEGEHQLVWSANSTVQDSNLVNQPSNFEDFLLKVEKDVPDTNIVSITIERIN